MVFPIRPENVRLSVRALLASSNVTVPKPTPGVVTGGFSFAPRKVVDKTNVAA